jgi:hypothetical protein
MTLMVLARDDLASDTAEARSALDQSEVNEAVLSHNSIKVICSKPYISTASNLEVYFPTPLEHLSDLKIPVGPLYVPSNLFRRFSRT